jgi:aryl-alcohol dehydrogenase-like predicted oxidoreductase
MEKIAFGKTGEMVSQYSLGCMLMGTATSKPDSFEMLDRFTAAGGNFLDTANCYAWWVDPHSAGDDSETLLGEWMQARGNRSQIFLATKAGARLTNARAVRDDRGEIIWERVPQTYEFLAPETIRGAIEDSLRRLQTDTIDLYYAHIDDRRTPLEETLGALNELVVEGKVRHIACSNLRTWRLERARSISAANGWAPYVAVQQQYSYLRPKPGADFGIGVHADEELLDYLRNDDGLTLVAYSPLLKGIYDDAQKRANTYIWPEFNSEDACARLAVLEKLAQELNVSNSQLVLAWLLHHQPRVIPIIGARTLEQYENCMAALEIQLTDENMSMLSSASG